jgi:sugar lactone lactonase YvrE
VDAQGRIWFGSMDDGEGAATGRLYRFDRGVVADTGLAPVTITNGPAISPDGRTLYHTDTLGRIIHRVPIQDDGSLGTPSVFATIDEADGWPDGAVCDADGFVWTGLWGGWRARRYAPTGDILAEVRLPAANVTKIAFGGADLRTAYAATARKGLDADALAGQPLAGNIFAFEVDVPGMPGNLASLG